MIEPLECREFARRLAAGEEFVILDVREPSELAVAALQGVGKDVETAPKPNVVHIPLGDLVSRFQELDPEQPTVCLCHHGVRSARAAGFLASQGFERLFNLSGGIDAWSLQVDPSVARY